MNRPTWTIRRAYIAGGCLASPGGVTPPSRIEPAAWSIVRRWNLRIPRNRVRVMTSDRFWSIRHALAVFTPGEVLAAIRFYSRQGWNRRHNAWKTFDAFIDLPYLTVAIEQAAESVEKRRTAHPQVDPAAARRKAEFQAGQERIEQLNRRFDSLPQARNDELLRRAAVALENRGVRVKGLGDFMVRQQALLLMEAEVASHEKKPGVQHD